MSKKVTFSNPLYIVYKIGNESRRNEYFVKSMIWKAHLERYHRDIKPVIELKLERVKLR